MVNEEYGDEALIHIMTILEEQEREPKKKINYRGILNNPNNLISEKRKVKRRLNAKKP